MRNRDTDLDPLPDPPDSITIGEFWYDEKYGRLPFDKSRTPFTCGVSGKSYTNAQMKERYELLARALSKRLGWRPNEDTHWDKVVGVFAFNSVSLKNIFSLPSNVLQI